MPIISDKTCTQIFASFTVGEKITIVVALQFWVWVRPIDFNSFICVGTNNEVWHIRYFDTPEFELSGVKLYINYRGIKGTTDNSLT